MAVILRIHLKIYIYCGGLYPMTNLVGFMPHLIILKDLAVVESQKYISRATSLWSVYLMR